MDRDRKSGRLGLREAMGSHGRLWKAFGGHVGGVLEGLGRPWEPPEVTGQVGNPATKLLRPLAQA
eukprot:8308037-Lingulodinium_polyedra.AAC.1